MKISKLIYMVILIISILLIISGCNTAPESSDSIANDNIQENKNKDESSMLKVAVFDFPPYMFISDDSITGPSIDVLKEAMMRVGYVENEDYQIVVYPWVRTLEMARSGDIDIIGQILRSEERFEYLDYSNEHHAVEQMVFITQKDSDITYDGNLSKMSHLTFGTILGFKYGEEFDKAISDGIVKVDPSNSPQDNIEKLILGRVDIVLEVKLVALSILKEKEAQDQIKILNPPHLDNYSYFGFSKVKNHKDLRDQIDQALLELRKDGTEAEIYSRYFDAVTFE